MIAATITQSLFDFLVLVLCVYFGSLMIIAIISAVWLAVFSDARLPLPELADHAWCPSRREIQFDMGHMNLMAFRRYGSIRAPEIRAHSANLPDRILDLGSGNGITTLLFLRSLLGANFEIILSDREPNIDAWRRICSARAGISYISRQVDIRLLTRATEEDLLPGPLAISLINALHHVEKPDAIELHDWAAARRVPLFIADASRRSFLHPLMVPFGYYFFYVFLTFTGSSRYFYRRQILRRLLSVAVESWIMSVDQMIGAARRYSDRDLEEMADRYGGRRVIAKDWLMTYILLLPK